MNGARQPAGRVVVVGSINLDLVARVPRLPATGETVTGGVFARHHGGKGANQAVAAARAGGDVVLVGAVGADDTEALPVLDADGVDTRSVQRIPEAWTGRALIVVAGDGENQIAVASGANHDLDAAHVRGRLNELALAAPDVVVLSFELCDPPLLAAVEVANAAGARLVVNPAPARDVDALLPPGVVATPNRSELAELTGMPTGTEDELRAAAGALAAGRSGTVVTTLGPDGALVTDGARLERVPAFAVDARDTTGAGDTLTGVLAAALGAGYDVDTAVHRAMAAAALAVTRPGARDGMPFAAQIDELVRSAHSRTGNDHGM